MQQVNESDGGRGARESDAEELHCLACGYMLRGLPENSSRCPECGRQFSLADWRTYDDGSGDSAWVRWARPPGLIHSVLVASVSACILWGASFPRASSQPCITALLPPLVVWYLFRAAVSLGALLQGIPPIRRRGRGWWFITPACLVLVTVSVMMHLPQGCVSV